MVHRRFPLVNGVVNSPPEICQLPLRLLSASHLTVVFNPAPAGSPASQHQHRAFTAHRSGHIPARVMRLSIHETERAMVVPCLAPFSVLPSKIAGAVGLALIDQ